VTEIDDTVPINELADTARRQAVTIEVLRQRVFELEIELINQRIAGALNNPHQNGD